MSSPQNDSHDILALALVGMFFIGTGAATTLLTGALTSVRDTLLTHGLLVPTPEAAIALGDTGVGLPLWLTLALAALAVGTVTCLMYTAARRRAQADQG